MQKLEYDPEVKILKIRFGRGKSVDLVNVDVMEVNLEDFIGITDHKKSKLAANNA
jgi:hypothetical protein